jgi:hypothetical protein
MSEETEKLKVPEADGLDAIQNAIAQLVRVLGKYSETNNKLSKRLFCLNIILTIATVVGAIATLLSVIRG